MGMCADPGSYRWCQAISRSRSLVFATDHKIQTKNNSTHNQTIKSLCASTAESHSNKSTNNNFKFSNNKRHYNKAKNTGNKTQAIATPTTIPITSTLETPVTTRTSSSNAIIERRKSRKSCSISTAARFQQEASRTSESLATPTPAAAFPLTTTIPTTTATNNFDNPYNTSTKDNIKINSFNNQSNINSCSCTRSYNRIIQNTCNNNNNRNDNDNRIINSIVNSKINFKTINSTNSFSYNANSSSYKRIYGYSLQLQHQLSQLFKSLLILFVLATRTQSIAANIPEDAVHITAILGEGVIFNCHVEFPNDHPVPYVLQWDKKVSETGSDLPIYIWYESYPEHIEEGYTGRVSRVSPDSPFGSASLNLTNIKESDQGWYECKVVFLNRDPKQHKNGTWFHLDVHAPPRFSVTPEDIIYVNLGDSIILNCQADGTPTPEILWYKDANPVDPSPTVGIFNDGTELRISTIRQEDIGEYTCIARNGEGQVSHTARVIIAGGAVIMVPPSNQTKLEGDKVIFPCEAKAMPGNLTVRWFREGSPVHEVASLESRITIRKDGSLIINSVSGDDSGQYLCEVTNGIGDPQSASAYLNVEFRAKVTFTPTVQYLPYGLSGVVQCYIKSNPQLQFVTWKKDDRLLEPYQMKDIIVMSNGSLLFERVSEEHQGRYTCEPNNKVGTHGPSGVMEVLVRKPPTFTVEPETLYQREVSETVEMHCDAVEAEGTQKPSIKWQRQDGTDFSESQRKRMKIVGGNITIENLRQEDFGYYQCVVSNEVATLISVTQLVIEGTKPHAPYNITGKATESSITLQWRPGYSGGARFKQDYTIWYREAGLPDWQTISVTPTGSTQVTINGLASGTSYEFQVVGNNEIGDGMKSAIMTVRTLEDAPAAPRNVKAATQPPEHIFQHMPDDADLLAYFDIYFHTDSNGSIVYSPPKLKLKGPKPGPPRNVTVTEVSNGFLISWQVPLERAHIVKFYTIKYRTDAQWKTLNRGQIRPEDTQYLVKNLVGGRTYYFRVLANSEKSYESSDEVKFPVPARVKHKAITAGVVGGILFFIVAIILSVCAVKICNKRKRRKQEKEFNMVACRITDARNIAANNPHLQRNHHNHNQQHQHQQQQQQQLAQHHQHYQHSNVHYQQHQHPQQRTTGSISASQVPLKKYKQTGISSLTTILIAILHWIWPPDRCTNCHSIYSSPHLEDGNNSTTSNYERRKSVNSIQRTGDGRFVIHDGATYVKSKHFNALTNGGHGSNGESSIDEIDGITTDRRRHSNASQDTSSDDGGFLSRRSFITARASWRRPLVASPSQLSLQSAADSARGFLQGLGGLLKIGSNPSGNNNIANDLLSGARYQNVYRQPYVNDIYRNIIPLHERQQQQPPSSTRPLHINTISGNLYQQQHDSDVTRNPNLFTPSRVSRIFSSSPASNALHMLSPQQHQRHPLDSVDDLLSSPWAMTTPNNRQQHSHFSDLSTVYPSSAERSFPTPNASTGNLSRYRYYTQELPSLRTIQEETRRMNQQQQQQQLELEHEERQLELEQAEEQQQREQHEFMPLQMPSPPAWRNYYQTQLPYYSYRPRTRWYPRHYSRLFGRSQSELLSPLPHLNLSLRGSVGAVGALEASPESRSSSSGFGSKNNSNHPHGSHHSGSTSEWRLLPPYKPPPPPPTTQVQAQAYFGSQHAQGVTPQQAQAQAPVHRYYDVHSPQRRPITPPYTMGHWLQMISRLNAATDSNFPKAVDVGSVDGHYEFDPATPTPSASTPTVGLLRDDLNLHIDTTLQQHPHAAQQQQQQLNLSHQSQHHSLGPMSGSLFHANASLAPYHGGLGGSATYTAGQSRHKHPRLPRYDNIEARLQAMREEFYAYRKQQAIKRAVENELEESVC